MTKRNIREEDANVFLDTLEDFIVAIINRETNPSVENSYHVFRERDKFRDLLVNKRK